jgi:argininosuccinate lyase
MAKLWKGRFSAGTHPLMEAFSESISFDRELAQVDIRGSLAHAKMLAEVGLISKKDLAAIRRGMAEIKTEIDEDEFVFSPQDEDIHMSIESALTKKIGDPAKKLHTARSRNDQVATDLRLWTRDKIDWLDRLVEALQKSLVELADKNRKLVMPGYTHLQRAQPVLLAQHLLAYVEMLARDRERLQDARRRVNRLPLGSCALAGTTLPIDREIVREELGFASLCENSMDAVSDRDFVIETLAALATMFIHFSRFAEDVILWASGEWGFLRLHDAWSTGSSIMPQKRNPDLLELTRGKTGRVVGSLMTILTVVKGLPMTYNRDLQEDKEPLFDAVRTAEATLACLAEFVPTMTFNEQRAKQMLEGGFLDATVMAEYLVENGLPFRSAHEVSGALVRLAEESGRRLCEVGLAEMKEICPLFQEDVFLRLDPAKTPGSYKSAGSAGTKEVAKALTRWKKRLR